MVKVYFETGSHAELVAIFASEELYIACLPTLEAQAVKMGYGFVTETLDEMALID